MPNRAQNWFLHMTRHGLHRAILIVCLVLAIRPLSAETGPHTACVQGRAPIKEVCFRHTPGAHSYGHNVLGNTPEWNELTATWSDGSEKTVRLSRPNHIFEDIRPRLFDLDNDETDEIIVVQSSFSQGARLLVVGIGEHGFAVLAATPYIGRSYRWLAPVGAADLDGDGVFEIAYIDRPHLAKRLRIWRYHNRKLEHVLDLDGLTNHRIGQKTITGGVRDCKGGRSLVVVSGDWRNVMQITLGRGKGAATPIGPYTGPGSIRNALAC